MEPSGKETGSPWGCWVAFLLGFGVLGAFIAGVLFELTGVHFTILLLLSWSFLLGMLFFFRHMNPKWERAAVISKVKLWSGWTCPHCKSLYQLTKGDAVEWVRRVYLQGKFVRHTWEYGVSLRRKTCSKVSSFIRDGRADDFKGGPDMLMVGGDQNPVNIPDTPDDSS